MSEAARWVRTARWLALVLLVVPAGCSDAGDCTSELRSAFSVSIALPGGTLPPDLLIRLYAPAGALQLETGAAEIAAGKSELCGMDPPGAGGKGGAVAADRVGCTWWFTGGGDPPWHGLLEATAAGYKPVHVELVAQATEQCNQPTPATANVSLEPL